VFDGSKLLRPSAIQKMLEGTFTVGSCVVAGKMVDATIMFAVAVIPAIWFVHGIVRDCRKNDGGFENGKTIQCQHS
jgi:hypothetical protein